MITAYGQPSDAHRGAHRWTIGHARTLRLAGHRNEAAAALERAGSIHRPAVARALAAVRVGRELTLF